MRLLNYLSCLLLLLNFAFAAEDLEKGLYFSTPSNLLAENQEAPSVLWKTSQSSTDKGYSNRYRNREMSSSKTGFILASTLTGYLFSAPILAFTSNTSSGWALASSICNTNVAFIPLLLIAAEILVKGLPTGVNKMNLIVEYGLMLGAAIASWAYWGAINNGEAHEDSNFYRLGNIFFS